MDETWEMPNNSNNFLGLVDHSCINTELKPWEWQKMLFGLKTVGKYLKLVNIEKDKN